MRSEDDTADLGAAEWRRYWRLSGWGLERTLGQGEMETKVEGGGD